MSSSQDSTVKELVGKIQQFLRYQLQTSSLSAEQKESLTVAVECIEQSYETGQSSASDELLTIYRDHKQRQSQQPQQQQPQTHTASGTAQFNLGPQAMAAFGSLASAAIQQLGTRMATPPQPAATAQHSTPTAASNPTTASTTTPSPTQDAPQPSAPRAPKVRKTVSESEKMAAESFKTQGNDYMKLEKYKEAHKSYSDAINIDNNNAIYYSNRAAASSKLGDHISALEDCKEAIEIDPTYSKAWGRMGHAHAFLGNQQGALDAYKKAVELDPQNETYLNNLRIAQEQVNQFNANAGQGLGAGAINNMFSRAMQNMRDPAIQNIMGLLGNVAAGATANPQPATEQTTTRTSAPQQTSQPPNANTTPTPGGDGQATNAAGQPELANDFINLASRLTSNIDLMQTGQQLISQLGQANPELINNMSQMFLQSLGGLSNPNAPGNAQQPGSNPNQPRDGNPPPGYI